MNVHSCLWCDRPATRLCDAPIGIAAVGARRDGAGRNCTLVTSVDAKCWTCDAPMCARHAKRIGWVCMRRSSASDTLDRCPWHTEHSEPPMRDLIMSEPEAETRRRQIHAEIRRQRMRGNG